MTSPAVSTSPISTAISTPRRRTRKDKKSRLFRIKAADGALEEVYEYGRPITSCAQPAVARGRMLSGDLHRDRIVVTRLAENSTADWPGAFGDPQTHQNAVVDPRARLVPMEEVQREN